MLGFQILSSCGISNRFCVQRQDCCLPKTIVLQEPFDIWCQYFNLVIHRSAQTSGNCRWKSSVIGPHAINLHLEIYKSQNNEVHIGIVLIPLRAVWLVLAISNHIPEYFDTSIHLNEATTVHYTFVSRSFITHFQSKEINSHFHPEVLSWGPRVFTCGLFHTAECNGPRVFTRGPPHLVKCRTHRWTPVGLYNQLMKCKCPRVNNRGPLPLVKPKAHGCSPVGTSNSFDLRVHGCSGHKHSKVGRRVLSYFDLPHEGITWCICSWISVCRGIVLNQGRSGFGNAWPSRKRCRISRK